MTKPDYFRMKNGPVLIYRDRWFSLTDHQSFPNSETMRRQPVDEKGQHIPGELLTIEKAAELDKQILQNLKNATGKVLAEAANTLVPGKTFRYLDTYDGDEMFEIVQNVEPVVEEPANEYFFSPPLVVMGRKPIHEVTVESIGDGEYDLFDQNGECLNEGCVFYALPTRQDVIEWVFTGKVKGKYE